MKSFQGFITENVLPTAQVADGSLDIEKPVVRAAINAALTGVTSQPAVTPYVVYNRISKLLAQYHIVLPKKFLEGDKGVEVFEVRQFGLKMGMTDSGEFINQVPSTHYLFLQYGIISPFGITYAKPVVGGMYKVSARLVDKEELDKLLDMAEITMSEEAECRQMSAKAQAPKEPMHDITSDEKKKGNKEAVADSQKKLDEVSKGAAISAYREKEAQERDTSKLGGLIKRKWGKKTAHHAERAGAQSSVGLVRRGEDRGKEDSIARDRRHPTDRITKSGKVHKQDTATLKGNIKRRLGSHTKPGHLPEEKGDRLTPGFGNRKDFDKIANEIGTGKGGMTIVDKAPKGDSESKQQTIYPMSPKSTSRVAPDDVEKKLDTSTPGNPKAERNSDIKESAPPGAKFERMVKHIKKGYSKDGLSAKEKSIAYATAWKAKKREQPE